MKKSFFLAVLMLTGICVHGQLNLVRNGNFEDRDTCPFLAGEVRVARYWNSLDTAFLSPTDRFWGSTYCSPWYVNTCSTNMSSGAPANGRFYQYPRSGGGMISSIMYYNDTFPAGPYAEHAREYMIGSLKSTLSAGQSYCVTFYVSMSNISAYAINNIGAYFDDGSIDTNAHCGWVHSQYTPQVLASGIIDDTLNWVKIQGSFVANGTEKYITIGNFTDTAHTLKIRRNGGHVSVYLVDDVSVIAGAAQAYAGPDKSIIKGDSATIGATDGGGGMPCYWYVLGGTSPIDSGGTIRVKPNSTTTYVVAMDLCGAVTYDTVTINVTNVGVSMLNGCSRLYPNPVDEQLIIGKTMGCNIALLNVQGHILYTMVAQGNTTTLDLSGYAPGLYLININDVDTGRKEVYRIVKK